MVTKEFERRIQAKIPKSIISATDKVAFPYLMVRLESLTGVLQFCAEDPGLKFDLLECLSGIDAGDDLILLYQLFSTEHGHRLNLKVATPRHVAKVPSATTIWRAAHYYELEAADMFGITFENHPQPRRLLLPEDWEGFPLRKDYAYPEVYGGTDHRRAPIKKEHLRP